MISKQRVVPERFNRQKSIASHSNMPMAATQNDQIKIELDWIRALKEITNNANASNKGKNRGWSDGTACLSAAVPWLTGAATPFDLYLRRFLTAAILILLTNCD